MEGLQWPRSAKQASSNSNNIARTPIPMLVVFMMMMDEKDDDDDEVSRN